MAENEVNVLMSVDLDAVETLKTIATLRTETAELRQQQKELDRTTAEGAVEYERLNAQIKANTKTIQQHEKEVVNSIKQDGAKAGSIKAMRAELSNAKAAYAELSKTEREGARGRELLDKTAALNAELKELEAAYGDNQRKVGEYENAGKSLRSEMRELIETLVQMKVAGQDTSPEFQQMSERLAELRDAMGDVNEQAGLMASDTSTFDTMTEGVQGVTAAYGVWKSASVAMGIENEAMDKTMRSLTVVLVALQSLTTLQNIAQKHSNLYRIAANALQKIGIKFGWQEVVATQANAAALAEEAAAENASTVAKTKGIVTTKLAAAAQWLWNAAMSANPAILLIAALLALVAGIAGVVSWMNKESDAAKDAAAAQEAYNLELEASENRLKELENAHKNNMRAIQLSARQTIEALKQQGVVEKEIRDAQMAGETELRNLEIEYQKQRQKESQDLIALKQQELQYWAAAQDGVREGGKKWKKYAESIKEAEAALVDLKVAADDAGFVILETMQDETEAQRQSVEAAKQATKEKADAAKQALDAAISRYEAELNAQKSYNEAFIKAEKGYQSTDFRTKQEYARRLFDLNAETERARLDNLRKNNRISEAEYKRSLEIMVADLTAFNNGQTAELSAYFDSERKAILGMLTQTLDEQIAETEKKYDDALKQLGNLEEEATVEQITLALRLEAEKNEKVKQLRESALANQIKQIEDASKKAYEGDLAQYQNNERKKLDILEKQLRDQIAAKKAAGIETYNEEAQLASIRAQRVQLDLNAELILAGDNAKKRYDAKKNALDAELAAAQGNADAILGINQRMADNDRELAEARIAAAEQWASAVGGILDGVAALADANANAQLQKVQEQYDAEKLALKDKYDKGLMSKAEYDKKSLELEKKKEKEEAKIERQRAIRERAMKVFSIVTDTAMGIAKAVAALPLTGGLPFSAIVAATGALNLAAVLSEPLPKAARGGLIKGPSHRGGGAVIEAEGGEAIMTKRAVSLFGPVLSALNELGGGVPFAAPLSDGGYTLRAASGMGSVTADEIAAAMKGVTIVTTVEDINRGQEQFAKIQARGSVL